MGFELHGGAPQPAAGGGGRGLGNREGNKVFGLFKSKNNQMLGLDISSTSVKRYSGTTLSRNHCAMKAS